MSTLASTNNMKKRYIKGGTDVAPEQGHSHGPTSTGSKTISTSLAAKGNGSKNPPTLEPPDRKRGDGTVGLF